MEAVQEKSSKYKHNERKRVPKSSRNIKKRLKRLYHVLFSRWHMPAVPSLNRYTNDIKYVVKYYSNFHNMIMEKPEEANAGTKNIISINSSAETVLIGTSVRPSATIIIIQPAFTEHV